MAENRKVLYKTQDGVTRVTLNRPDKRNALDTELVRGLKEVMAATAVHAKCRVVLLTGSGTDFCAGADLAAVAQTAAGGILENIDDARDMAELFLMMRNHPRPIIAAVQGRAFAGGCGLATACDIVLASESAKFAYTEVNLGFVAAMVMAMLRRSVSEKAAFELVASGDVIAASRARELGFVHHVFPDARFDDDVEAYVGRIAAKSTSALMLTKRLLYQMDSMSFEAALGAGVQANAIARMTEDCRNGVETFLSARSGASRK